VQIRTDPPSDARGTPEEPLPALCLALFGGCTETRPRPARMTWPELASQLARHRERAAKDGPCWSPTLPPSLPSLLCCRVCGRALRSEDGSGQSGGPGRRRVSCESCARLLLAPRDALREDARGGPVRRGRAQ
jgi:hypothetical protein